MECYALRFIFSGSNVSTSYGTNARFFTIYIVLSVYYDLIVYGSDVYTTLQNLRELGNSRKSINLEQKFGKNIQNLEFVMEKETIKFNGVLTGSWENSVDQRKEENGCSSNHPPSLQVNVDSENEICLLLFT